MEEFILAIEDSELSDLDFEGTSSPSATIGREKILLERD